MPEQRCVCGHPFSIHRLNRQLGSRNECWALNDQPPPRYCGCRQFMQAAPGSTAGAEGECPRRAGDGGGVVRS